MEIDHNIVSAGSRTNPLSGISEKKTLNCRKLLNLIQERTAFSFIDPSLTLRV